MTDAENNPSKPRVVGRPFQAGKPSANPRGRPRGSTNRKSIALYQILEPHGSALLQRALQMALDEKNADAVILKDLLAKLLPNAPRSMPIKFDLPPGTHAEQGAAVLAAAADGRITLDDATQLVNVISSVVRIVEATEVIERLARIEEQLAQGVR